VGLYFFTSAAGGNLKLFLPSLKEFHDFPTEIKRINPTQYYVEIPKTKITTLAQT
jgi:hypothetical protein